MKEKKFYGVGIGFGIVGVIGAMFDPVAGLVFGIISLWANLKNREQYRVKIGVAFAVISLLCSIAFLAWMIWIGATMPNSGTDYWLFELIFGKRGK